ncbi:MAG: TolC family protein [Acidobacteria bacterium]|nr:TolC family protein [Acidobacteriota bacterium]
MRFARYLFVCLSGVLLTAGAQAAEAGQAQTPPSTMPPAAAQPMPGEADGPVRQLSIDDAVALALKNNLGLEIERLNPQIEDEAIAQARAPYLPTLQASFGKSGATNEPRSFTEGSQVYSESGLSSSFTVSQPSVPLLNTQLQATWSGARGTTDILGPSFNPSLQSSLFIQGSQPLWRGLLINPVKTRVEQAVLSRQISDITLRQRVVGTERSVRQAYWQLVGAIERLSVARQNLDLSNEQLRANRVRVEVGTMAPIDIIAAQAEVAGNEEAVITAEAGIRSAEDQLRTLIFDPNSPEFWSARIQPTNAPLLQPLDVNLESAVRTALESRTDIVNARKQLQISDLSVKLAKNDILPNVSLNGDIRASGSGGTRFVYVPGTTQVDNRFDTSFSSALGDAFGFVYPRWNLNVTYSYPIGKEAAQATHARATLQRQQADAQLKQLEMGITQQVRQAARNVNTNYQRVQTTRVARELAEQRLAAQQKRFDVGLSTLFELTQAQRDVVLQRNNELNAVIDYNQSLVDFQLVQVAPLGGGGF